MNRSITFSLQLLTGLIVLLVQFCTPAIAFGQLRTQINLIKAGESEVPHEKWNNLIIPPHESVTLNYSVEGSESLTGQILYKIFLNGKVVEPKLSTPQDAFIKLEDLPEGVFIVKVQAYLQQGPEIIPAIIKFSVRQKEQNSGSSKTETSGNTNNYSVILKYVLLITGVLLIAAIFMYLKRKPRSAGEGQDKQKDNSYFTPSGQQSRKDPGKSEQENELLKSYNMLNAEFEDLSYSYERLKKECGNLKETNTFLKQQISSLKLDITDLETANVQLLQQKEKLLESKRQLEELQSQKDELFAIAIHDIKNPAAAIRGYVELLESYDLNAQEQQEVMQSLVDTSSHIIQMAQNMSLVVSKTKPEPILTLEKASIKAIADSVCNRNAGYALKKNVKLINQTSPHTPETQLDISKIEEVFDNLINNAIKYAPKETVVQVKSYFSESKITVEVSDNGVGLSEEDCKKAFTKGSLLTPEPTDGEVRSGLGLWIVKKIIEEHDGKVFVKSKLGYGSTFSFELPVKK